MASKPDPRIAEVVALLPADGSKMTHRNWRQAIIDSGKLGNLAMTRAAQQQRAVVVTIDDPEHPADSLMVARAPQQPSA